MNALTLRLTTPQLDELGRLTVPNVHVSSAGEASALSAVPIADQMTGLYARIRSAVAAEGMEIALEDLDFQLTVSRVILSNHGSGEPIVISLPVRSHSAANTESAAETGVRSDWDDLFDISDELDGREVE